MKLCFYRREALRVRFTVDGKADASEGAGGGGGEASGEAMILCVCVRGCGFDLRKWNLLQLRCIPCSEFGDLVGVGSSVDPK